MNGTFPPRLNLFYRTVMRSIIAKFWVKSVIRICRLYFEFLMNIVNADSSVQIWMLTIAKSRHYTVGTMVHISRPQYRLQFWKKVIVGESPILQENFHVFEPKKNPKAHWSKFEKIFSPLVFRIRIGRTVGTFSEQKPDWSILEEH